MSSTFVSSRFVALGIAALLSAVVACSVTSPGTGFSDPDASVLPTEPSGSSGSSGSSRPSGSGADAAPASCADPTCPREICQCGDKSLAGASNVCRSNGTCDVVAACSAACGSAGFSGGSFEYKPCASAIDCETSQPTVSCSCRQGFGEDADAVCKDNYCSSAAEDVCPAACASEGGWSGCTSPADCAPLVCQCKDGASPATGAACNAGTCGPPSGQCPALCASHGGWSSTGGGGGMDAGPPGPKQPGDSCSAASECTPFDCACNNGQTYKNNKLCESHVCASQAEACGFVCQASGGWSGK
jgi:hypothetical protein